MERDDTKRLLMEIERLYPDAARAKDPKGVVDIWTEVLANEEFEQMHECLVQFVRTDTFGRPPKPGQLMALKPQPYDDRGLKDWGIWTE
jgi:hypothetical protein